MKAQWLVGVAAAAALGCVGGGPKYVPVSGVVTLNGKPLAGATVTFSPIAPPGEVNAGDGSAGKTNDAGEFTLTTSRGAPGALVGKHKVRIFALARQVGTGDERPPRGGWPTKDKVPARYNERTELEFEVKPDGPNKADLPLTSS